MQKVELLDGNSSKEFNSEDQQGTQDKVKEKEPGPSCAAFNHNSEHLLT